MSTYSPLANFTYRCSMDLNALSTSSPGWYNPAICRMLSLRSSVLLACWTGRSNTAAVDTTTAQTRHNRKATSSVLPTLSFLAAIRVLLRSYAGDDEYSPG